jgi:uncharacterized membrane protein
MEMRPKIRIELSKSDRLIEILAWTLLALLWFLTLLFYDGLPETIPIHFNEMGHPNDYGSKMTIMFLPVFGTLLFLGLTTLNKYPHIFNLPVKVTEINAYRQYTNATRMIRVLKLVIMVVFSLAVVMIIKAAKIDSDESNIWLLPVIIGLVVIPITYFILKSIKMK